MSQSASFYSIAAPDFLTIQNSDDHNLDLSPFIKDSCTLEGTFMGLEYTMVKKLDEGTATLIEEIFNPSESYGGADFSNLDLDTINPEVLEKMVMDDASVYYLSPETISKILPVLEKLTEKDIAANFNSSELNENDVYPACWNDSENNGTGFNKLQLINDFKMLKSLLNNAALENYYIITYVGG